MRNVTIRFWRIKDLISYAEARAAAPGEPPPGEARPADCRRRPLVLAARDEKALAFVRARELTKTRELVAHLGCSQDTAEACVRRLRERGLVTVRHGVGIAAVRQG